MIFSLMLALIFCALCCAFFYALADHGRRRHRDGCDPMSGDFGCATGGGNGDAATGAAHHIRHGDGHDHGDTGDTDSGGDGCSGDCGCSGGDGGGGD